MYVTQTEGFGLYAHTHKLRGTHVYGRQHLDRLAFTVPYYQSYQIVIRRPATFDPREYDLISLGIFTCLLYLILRVAIKHM